MNQAKAKALFACFLIFSTLIVGFTIAQTPPGANTIQHGEGSNMPTVTSQYGYFYGVPPVNVTGRLFGDFAGLPLTGATLDTGQGAGELYPMDQAVRTTDSVAFSNVTSDEYWVGTWNATGAMRYPVTEASYVVWADNSTGTPVYYAKNGMSGAVDFSVTDIGEMFDSLVISNPDGFHLHFKEGNFTQLRQWDIKGTDNVLISGSGPSTVFIRKNQAITTLTVNAFIGENHVHVASTAGFVVGEQIEVSKAPSYDIMFIQSIVGDTITFTANLANNYVIGDDVFSVWSGFRSDEADNLYLSDFKMMGNSANWPKASVFGCSLIYHMYIWRGDNRVIERVIFEDFMRLAVNMGPNNTVSGYGRGFIKDCVFTDGEMGIAAQAAGSYVVVEGCTFTNMTGQSAIESENGEYIRVQGCHFDDIAQYAFFASTDNGKIHFLDNRGEGIVQVRGTVGETIISRNTLTNTVLAVYGKTDGTNQVNFIVSDNTLTTTVAAGGWAIYLKDCENGIITDNVLIGPGAGTVGIRILTDVKNINIHNNKFRNLEIGIQWNGGAETFYVTDNDLVYTTNKMSGTISTGAIFKTQPFQFTEPINGAIATTSPTGVDVDGATEGALVWGQLPSDVQQVVRIKVWAVSTGTPIGAGGQMHAAFTLNAGAANAAYNTATKSWAITDFDGADADYVANDIVHWIILDASVGNELKNLLAGDSFEFFALYNAGADPDGATDAVFRCIEVEYV